MMEGSATLLINGHETLEDLEKQRDVEGYIAKVPELLPAMENTLRRSLKGADVGRSICRSFVALF
jgi:hypothetical protein